MSQRERITGDSATTSAFKRRFMRRLVFVLAGGMFLDGYILGIVGPVTGSLTADLGLSTLWEGLIAAAPLFGIFFGSPAGGWAADRFGRKPLFMVDMGLFVVASGLQFFVDSPELLFVVRLMMGLAIGMEYSVGWPLMSEFAPAELRGRLLGVTLIAWYTGFMVAFALGYWLAHSTTLGWRVILGTSTLLAVVLFVARFGLPESPRWLWNQGRKDEAMAVAHRYMAHAAEMSDVEHEDTEKGTFKMLFSRRYWRATLFVSMFWFCAVAPYFAIATFADSVLGQYGLGGGLAGGVGLSAVALSAVILTVLLIDKVGRRVLTVPPQWICTVLLAVIGLWAGAPPAAVLTLFLAFSFFNAMVGTLTGVYPGEVFPTEVRCVGTGFAAAVSRIGAGLGTFLLPWAMVNLGPATSMLIAAGIAFVGAALSQWLAPETKGKSLTEAAAGFSH
ncbi:MFS transporter [Arthrobacter cupressi]|uniref:MFS transporter, putative metabolite transport protein n=1 Tax=Arthrobacter cupressi TaxID=1045773 RepID=A0A1G8TL85_9MICC|nr:MFS transporter [Arthrobacter cupressi]NYD79709.1 putative MFS transporter [Arthrobacter cupressi]SDJ42213.1 MFS transporter, putative metabolite transport protein [Arthrobacter cupressi]